MHVMSATMASLALFLSTTAAQSSTSTPSTTATSAHSTTTGIVVSPSQSTQIYEDLLDYGRSLTASPPAAFSEVAAILATAFNQAELRSIVNSELYGAPDPSGSGFFASIATAPVTFTTLPWETALPSNVAKDYAAYATKAQCDVRGIVRNDLGLPDDAQASACRALASSTGGAAAARPTAMAARVAGVAAGVAGVFGAAALL